MTPLLSRAVHLAVGYVAGLMTKRLVALVAKPVLRGAVKATVRVAGETKKLAAEATEDLRDLATEVASR